MHRGFSVVIPAFLLSLFAATAEARDPLTIPDQTPQNFQQVQQGVQSIPPYLAQVQCGGWKLSQSVGGVWSKSNANGTIAGVSGLPGHVSQWNGDISSGVATRSGDFYFPDSANGLATTCAPNQSEITKKIWVPAPTTEDSNAITQVEVTYPHPFFQNPSCRWRIKTKNSDGTIAYSNKAPDIPLKSIDQYDPPIEYGEMQNPTDGTATNAASGQKEPGDRQSPINCQDFSNYLNTFQYEDCLCPQFNAQTGNMDCPADGWGDKYLCTDQANTHLPPDCTNDAVDHPELSNSIECQGQQCRCQQNSQPGDLGCLKNPSPDPAQENLVYYSYIREYTAQMSRASVQGDGPADHTTFNDVPVACFGFYDEFDPQTHTTLQRDRRCVIDIDVSTMRDSQRGKGDYGQNSSQVDVDPEAQGNQRSESSSDESLWFTKLGWGFSLLNESAFQNSAYNEDLTNVFLNTDALDKAKMTASWPVANQNQKPGTAQSDYVRSFDDTGTGRIISNWWQKQQTTVATLLHPVVVRLILPPGYAFGVDPSSPIFGGQSSSNSSVGTDMRSQRMEVQIPATEDAVGQAIQSIQTSLLLHLQENPVPVLVPFGSPTDFRAKAEQWCGWYMQQANAANCDNAPQKIKDFIDQLNSYADDIEKERVLRAQLATYAGNLLQLEQKLRQPISDWVKKNLTAYRDFLQKQKELNQGVSAAWQNAETAMSIFHDQTNMPWCMNQRFEPPVYSLLDNWLPSRISATGTPDGIISSDRLPNVPTIPVPQDVLIDFSHIAYLTGALAIPVLKPVQVAVTIDAPTATTTLDNFSETLPDFPSLDPVVTAMNSSISKLPKVQTGSSFPPLSLPTIDDSKINEVLSSIQQITDLIGPAPTNGSPPNDTSMNGTYDAFWESIGPLTNQQNGQTYKPDTKCGDESIQNLKEHEQCCSWNDRLCQHVEMDLLEQFQRIGSRKLIFLKEDYTSTGALRMTPDNCVPSDQTCLLLHGEAPKPIYQTQINPPKKGMPDLTTDAAKQIRDATLPQPIGTIDPTQFPPYAVRPMDLLLIEDVPQPIDLTPPSSSSSSAKP